MTVYLGNYLAINDNNTAYDRQRNELDAALQTYGVNNIGGVTVGNEVMLNYLTANGATDPNSATGNQGAELLIADINDTRTNITSLNLSRAVPIGTSDAGSYFNNEVLGAVDYAVCFINILIQTLSQPLLHRSV